MKQEIHENWNSTNNNTFTVDKTNWLNKMKNKKAHCRNNSKIATKNFEKRCKSIPLTHILMYTIFMCFSLFLHCLDMFFFICTLFWCVFLYLCKVLMCFFFICALFWCAVLYSYNVLRCFFICTLFWWVFLYSYNVLRCFSVFLQCFDVFFFICTLFWCAFLYSYIVLWVVF